MLLQVQPRRRVGLDRARGGDVVGRDRVAQQREHARTLDVGHVGRLGRHPLEVRRQVDVGRLLVPREAVAGRHLQRVPALVAGEDVVVGGAEHLRAHRALDGLADLLARRPQVAQIDVHAVSIDADRVVDDVRVHRARQRVGDHQRRRRQVVHLHVGVDATLEVAVARQHRDDRQVVLGHRLRHRARQRPRVADARRAAVADEVEAERLEVVGQPGVVEVLRHDLRARRQRRLHPRLGLRPRATALRATRPAASITDGLDVFVHDVIAAMTTWPLSSRVAGPSMTIGTLAST